ncbi:unnamed protein product [Brachionus calyciflorus]|uniref:Uncharacterized protein n=1 Tax=Brachionus calyciflorus TaxID=104777 RepID=A0A814JE44_9BILA|nr:unnamed protein product [Brachionus calyciflorus]
MVKIIFSKNRIKSLSSKLFRGLHSVENIGFDFNLIESIAQGMFSNLYSLLVTDFSNNRINFFDINQLPKSLWIVDFTQNFNINDFSITFESCFTFKDKNFWGFEDAQKETYYKAIQYYLEFESNRKIWILSDDIKVKFKNMIDSPDKYQVVQSYKVNWAYNVDNVNYLTKNTDLEQLKSRFCSVFLNKSRTNPNTLFTANPKNCLDSLNFNQRLKKLENLDWSVLDYFIFLPKYVFSTQDLINYHRYITQRIEQNLFVVNLDYTFRTSEVIEAFFERDDEYLIDIFIPKQSLQDFISNKNNDDENSLKKIYKYINAERLMDFFLNINYSKCLEISIEKDNQVMAIYLMILLKFTIKNDKITLSNQSEYLKIAQFN